MAAKKPVDPLKAKEARQKKIAIGGAIVLVLVLAIQVPKLMKQLSHSSAPPPQPPASTTAAPPAATPAPGATPSASPSTGTGSLLSQNAPTAAIGQLSSFGSFASKDPFAAPAPAPAGPATTTTAKPPKSPPPPPTPPAPPTSPTSAQTYTSALISVNGVKEQVAAGANFPSSQPFFHLVSVSAHSAKISIAGGSLATGAATVTLEEGKPLTLMNTTDGTRYKIVLLPQQAVGTGTTVSGSASGGGSSAATTTAATTTAP